MNRFEKTAARIQKKYDIPVEWYPMNREYVVDNSPFATAYEAERYARNRTKRQSVEAGIRRENMTATPRKSKAKAKKKTRRKNPANLGPPTFGQFFGFRVRGKSVKYVGQGGTMPIAWTDRGNAIAWKSRRLAVQAIHTLTNRSNPPGYYYGVAPVDMTAAQILAEVKYMRGKA